MAIVAVVTYVVYQFGPHNSELVFGWYNRYNDFHYNKIFKLSEIQSSLIGAVCTKELIKPLTVKPIQEKEPYFFVLDFILSKSEQSLL